jgi:hypothetical protein
MNNNTSNVDYNYRKEITYKEYLILFEKIADWNEEGTRSHRPITEEEAERIANYQKLQHIALNEKPPKYYLTYPYTKTNTPN